MDQELKWINDGETDNHQLYKMCVKYNVPLKKICFKDQLKLFKPEKGAYIINMANSGSDGSHWIGLFLVKPTSYYYDSYGIAPPNEIVEFIKKYGCKDYEYSDSQLQSIKSNYCGQYVFLFLYFMTHSNGSYENRYLKYLKQFSIIRYIRP